MDWGKLLGFAIPAVGKLLSGGAKDMERSREGTNRDNISRDRTAADALAERERALLAREKLLLEQRELNNKTQNDGFGQTIRAQSIQNYRPATRPSRIPMTTGSFNTVPQASKDFAKQYEQQAMVRALQGEKFDPMAPVERFTPTPVKEPSLWEKLTGAAGLGLQATSAIRGLAGRDGAGDEDFMGPQ